MCLHLTLYTNHLCWKWGISLNLHYCYQSYSTCVLCSPDGSMSVPFQMWSAMHAGRSRHIWFVARHCSCSPVLAVCCRSLLLESVVCNCVLISAGLQYTEQELRDLRWVERGGLAPHSTPATPSCSAVLAQILGRAEISCSPCGHMRHVLTYIIQRHSMYVHAYELRRLTLKPQKAGHEVMSKPKHRFASALPSYFLPSPTLVWLIWKFRNMMRRGNFEQ